MIIEADRVVFEVNSYGIVTFTAESFKGDSYVKFRRDSCEKLYPDRHTHVEIGDIKTSDQLLSDRCEHIRARVSSDQLFIAYERDSEAPDAEIQTFRVSLPLDSSSDAMIAIKAFFGGLSTD